MTARTHRMDRRALFASGAAAALLAATGVSAQTRPQSGGRLRLAVSGADRRDTFDMRRSKGLFMKVAAVGAVFDTLTEVAADGTLRGELALRWQSDSDAQSWVFDLRDDAVFHDGTVFTSEDVVSSLELHRHTGLSGIDRLTVLGPYRIKIDLKHADPHLPFTLSGPEYVIYPARNMERAMLTGIGTGLYRVTKFDAGRQLIGTRVDAHYKDGEAGWFDQVELVSIPANDVRTQALREHLIDAADFEEPGDMRPGLDIALLPENAGATYGVWRDIGMPSRLGGQRPLDNLRAAERWWKA